MMDVRIIEVPYMTGDQVHPASKGPGRWLEAGAAQRVADYGIGVTVEQVERGAPYTDPPTASMEVSRQLEPRVRLALDGGAFPLVLAGTCDVSMGILSAFDHNRCGIIWVDAHGDFNTPETTISGFFGGMPLAVLAGDCYQDLWARVGNSVPIPAEHILMIGIRDLDPAERVRLDAAGIERIEWRGGQPQGDIAAALDRLAARVSDVYLHLDIDALDHTIAPGVNYLSPGGLSLEAVEALIRAVAARFRIRAAAMTAFDPTLDRDNQTAQTGLRMIDVLAETAAR